MKRPILCTVLSLGMSCAFACSSAQPGQTKDVTFGFNSIMISNAEIVALANWIVDTRSKSSTLEGVSIVGLADAHERNPHDIAENRAKNVKQILEVLGVQSATMQLISHIYKPTMPNDKYEPTGTRAEVTLIPACANE